MIETDRAEEMRKYEFYTSSVQDCMIWGLLGELKVACYYLMVYSYESLCGQMNRIILGENKRKEDI